MFLYSLLQYLLISILFVGKKFSTNKKFLAFYSYKNKKSFNSKIELAKKNYVSLSTKPEIIWIHVASAGELEQAIPVANKLFSSGKYQFFLTYFSPSAEPFIKNFPGLIGHCGFPLDFQENHVNLINSLNIKNIILVRYDLWPNIFFIAKKMKIKLHLLAATKDNAKNSSLNFIKTELKKYFYSYFYNIFVVNSSDLTYFKSLSLPANIYLAGDSKWARAKERAELVKQKGIEEKLGFFANFIYAQKAAGKTCFVFGSPHKEEHEVALNLAKQANNSFIIYVPHDVSAASIEKIMLQGISLNLKIKTFTQLSTEVNQLTSASNSDNIKTEFNFEQDLQMQNDPSSSNFLFSTKSLVKTPIEILNSVQIVVINKMGILAEIYSIADLAIVGGGFDGQIHNCLEPAAHPVVTLFGKNFSRAAEVKVLVEKNCAKAFATPNLLFDFLTECATLKNGMQFEEGNAISQELLNLQKNSLEVFQTLPNTSEIIFQSLLK